MVNVRAPCNHSIKNVINSNILLLYFVKKGNSEANPNPVNRNCDVPDVEFFNCLSRKRYRFPC
jgi:hypothetical protein